VSAGNQRQRSASKLLINSRIDVALAVGADGVHLRSTDISASDARAVAMQSLQTLAEGRRDFIISAACHSNAEVRVAEAHGADLVLFGPIFEKVGGSIPPHGIAGLRAACRDDHAASPPVQVLALGSVTLANAHSCVQAGAHGIAGIRLFQEGDLAETLKKIRSVDRTLELEKQPQD
jgi:thiamine-phosphate pyrophosphorylase